ARVSGAGHRAPPVVDLSGRAGDEGDVQIPGERVVLARRRDREVLPLRAEHAGVGVAEPELPERDAVEAPGSFEVGDADRDVVENVDLIILAAVRAPRTRPSARGSDPSPN